MSKRKNDLVGQVFGRLEVLERAATNTKHSWFICKCECGATKAIRSDLLRRGLTKSCGCLSKEVARVTQRKSFLKHGESIGDKTVEYSTWTGMKARCFNKANPAFANYGGRGITICPRWMQYENFLADMGRKPSPDLSIDRINNDGNYEPGNCRWATKAEQWDNQRHVYPPTPRGEKHALAKLTEAQAKAVKQEYSSGKFTQLQISEKYGVSFSLVSKIWKGHLWKHLNKEQG